MSQDKEWKDKYVSQLISICGPFAGAAHSIVEYINAKPFEWIDRSYVDLVACIPFLAINIKFVPSAIIHKRFSGVWDNITFVQTPGKNYTGVDSIYEILGLLQNISIGRKERNFIDYGLKFLEYNKV